jgi:CrcB protein|tara:strand:- start:1519 stop:1890 length:372 start_codon:yes stop_codon:yes gene_type:complete
MQWLAVAFGGALGSLARYAINTYTISMLGERSSLGTLIVNLTGSILIGCCYVFVVERGFFPSELKNFLMVGFLGAFTTFSAFTLETIVMWQNDQIMLSILYIFGTIFLCLMGTLCAITLMRLI